MGSKETLTVTIPSKKRSKLNIQSPGLQPAQPAQLFAKLAKPTRKESSVLSNNIHTRQSAKALASQGPKSVVKPKKTVVELNQKPKVKALEAPQKEPESISTDIITSRTYSSGMDQQDNEMYELRLMPDSPLFAICRPSRPPRRGSSCQKKQDHLQNSLSS